MEREREDGRERQEKVGGKKEKIEKRKRKTETKRELGRE